MTQPMQHQPRQMQQSHQHHAAAPAPHKPLRLTGRKPRAYGNLPHYSALRLLHPHPQPPVSADWLSALPADLGMMLNGYDAANPGAPQLGCCPIAALHHARQVWSKAGSGTEVTDPNADVLTDYERFCGYVPGNQSTDCGGVLQNVLAGAYKDGITTATGVDKLLAYVEIDPRQQMDIKSCIAFGGGVYLGIRVSQSLENANPGDVINRTDDITDAGHCVWGGAYDADGIWCITWGFRIKLTWEAFAAMCDEAYFLADACFIDKTGHTPSNLTQADLIAAMQSVRVA